jgi:predicted phage terminase large subunit-like protein
LPATTVERGLDVRVSPYWPHPPSAPQFVFLSLPHEEALYGGAAGGGKSDALLMGALQYVDIPGYAAVIVRRSYSMLTQPDALIPRSHEWLGGTDARWNEKLAEWKFPSGAVLKFAYLDSKRDLDNFQGPAYQFIGWDELTQFRIEDYVLVSFSRNRRRADVRVPIRVRSASNPGGRGHDAVRDRFGLYRPDDATSGPMVCQLPGWREDRVFIPARVRDNPGLDVEDYTRRMAENLDHHTRRQLLDGDWDSRPPGDLFRREWFGVVDAIPAECQWVRRWDLAATEVTEANPDPDWTVGARIGLHPNGDYFVEDVVRFRSKPAGVLAAIVAAAERDGIGTVIWLPQDPGQAGKAQVDSIVRDTRLRKYAVKAERETGSKFERAKPVSAKAERGMLKLKRAKWNGAFLDEHEAFTEDETHSHDDIVDAVSGAISALGTDDAVSQDNYRGDVQGEPVTRSGDIVLVGEQYVDKD